MALTRKAIKAMGLTDEQVDSIIEMHTETVDGLKAEIAKNKADAEKLPAVQKELDDLKAKGDDGWKDKHDKVKKDFDDYKAGVEAKETKAAKEQAVRAYYESKNIKDANLNIAMRSSGAEIDAVELDGDKIKDTAALDDLISGDLANLVTKPGVVVDTGAKLKTGGKPMTKEEIYKRDERGRYVMSASERQKALAENPQLFN